MRRRQGDERELDGVVDERGDDERGDERGVDERGVDERGVGDGVEHERERERHGADAEPDRHGHDDDDGGGELDGDPADAEPDRHGHGHGRDDGGRDDGDPADAEPDKPLRGAMGRGRGRGRRLGRGAGRVLSLEWRRWLVENVARGADGGALAAILAGAGVPAGEAWLRIAEARAWVTAARAGEGARAGEAERRARAEVEEAAEARASAEARARRAEAALRLRAALRGPIERRATPTAAEFFAAYWATNTPVILTDLVRRWPAFGRWGAEDLRARFGEVEVEAEIGRGGDPAPDVNFAAHRRRIRLGDFVDRALAAGVSDDLYMIAQNRNLARPELRPLLDEVWLPEGYFAVDRLAGGAALWFGPAGTVTRLHHDCSNILLCQVVGRKRVRLGAPEDPALLAAARGVYSAIDPEAGSGAAVLEDMTLEPGEALFIPVGWWHHVRALELSVSVALNAFARANDFGWYMPGRGAG